MYNSKNFPGDQTPGAGKEVRGGEGKGVEEGE